MFDTAVLRSGYQLKDQVDFSKRIMNMLYKNLDIDPSTPVSFLLHQIRKIKKVLLFLKTKFVLNFCVFVQIEAEPEEEEEAEEEEDDDEEEVDADEGEEEDEAVEEVS